MSENGLIVGTNGRVLTSSMVAKSQKTNSRTYQAAEVNRLTADWVSVNISTNHMVYKTQKILRARSRDEVANNDYCRRYLQILRQNCIGPQGIKLHTMFKNTDDSMDKAGNEAITKAWDAWSVKLNCDVTGHGSLRELEAQALEYMATDGEAIMRVIRDPNGSDYGGYAIQFIDPSMLDIDLNVPATSKGGLSIQMGIELNKYDRPTAFYFKDSARSETALYNTAELRTATKHIRVPANEVLHLYVRTFVGQLRGLPWFSTPMLRLHNLNGLEESAVIASRVGASTSGFFTNESGEEYEGELANDGSTIMNAEPGQLTELPPGWKFEEFSPDFPSGYKDFVKTTLRGVASGLGISYHTLAGDLESVNFSSARAGLEEDKNYYITIQEFMVDNMMMPVYQGWITFAMVAGRVVSPRGIPLPFSKVDKFRHVTFRGRRWGFLEPLKDAKASETSIAIGIKSRSQIIRDMGGDPDTVFAEIKLENEKLDELGITFLPSSDDADQPDVVEEPDETTDKKDDDN